jgi:hypothetical protein
MNSKNRTLVFATATIAAVFLSTSVSAIEIRGRDGDLYPGIEQCLKAASPCYIVGRLVKVKASELSQRGNLRKRDVDAVRYTDQPVTASDAEKLIAACLGQGGKISKRNEGNGCRKSELKIWIEV